MNSATETVIEELAKEHAAKRGERIRLEQQEKALADLMERLRGVELTVTKPSFPGEKWTFTVVLPDDLELLGPDRMLALVNEALRRAVSHWMRGAHLRPR